MSTNNYKQKKSISKSWEQFIAQFEEKKSPEVIIDKTEQQSLRFLSDEILSQLYHDLPICMHCGYPSNTNQRLGPFGGYFCPYCHKDNIFHPKAYHENHKIHNCLLPVELGNLEKMYIDWACTEKFSGVHLITWPDSFIRFSPILAYALFSFGFKKTKISKESQWNVIVHISPKSPSLSSDIIYNYEHSDISSSCHLNPSVALGYLHICIPDEKSLMKCTLDDRFISTSNRGGYLQTKSMLSFVTDFSNWEPKKFFYVVTNEKFILTGFTLDQILTKISLNIDTFKLTIILDDLSVYLTESKIAGLASFIQICSQNNVPLLAFIPRTNLRYKILDLFPLLDIKEITTHTIDTKERINYLGENNYFLKLSFNKPISPYSTYFGVANIWH
jgi:hypothetical protein